MTWRFRSRVRNCDAGRSSASKYTRFSTKYSRNHGFHATNDGFYAKTDGFHTRADGFHAKDDAKHDAKNDGGFTPVGPISTVISSSATNTSNCKRNGHCLLQNHRFSWVILHYLCIFNRKFKKKLAFILQFTVRS